MNFREKFEAWHLARFGYVTPPRVPFTAFNCTYPDGKQQDRWVGWQACHTNAYDEGKLAGRKELIDEIRVMAREEKERKKDPAGWMLKKAKEEGLVP